jgi:Fe2+ or Zn2+ uptake regulation protein
MVKEHRLAPGKIRDAVLKSFERHRRAASVSEIMQDVGVEIKGRVPPSSVRSYLQILVKFGRITRLKRGVYEFVK